MGSETRLSSYCSKRGNNTMNLVTSRKTNARLARPIISDENTLICPISVTGHNTLHIKRKTSAKCNGLMNYV